MIAPSYFEYQERRTQRSNAHDLIEWPDIVVTESELPEPSTCTAAGSSSAPAESQKDFERIAGKRFVCIDLDVVITDLRPLWNRPEDFV